MIHKALLKSTNFTKCIGLDFYFILVQCYEAHYFINATLQFYMMTDTNLHIACSHSFDRWFYFGFVVNFITSIAFH